MVFPSSTLSLFFVLTELRFDEIYNFKNTFS